MSSYKEFFNEQLKDDEIRKEYELLEPEFEVVRTIIQARKEKGITQKQLSEITGIAQGDISKIENGNANPSIKTLKRIAAGMGKKLEIRFI